LFYSTDITYTVDFFFFTHLLISYEVNLEILTSSGAHMKSHCL
jgi:hypothetical protein